MIKDSEAIEKNLMKLHDRRDKVLTLSREEIRIAGRAITLIHTGDMQKANSLLKELKLLDRKLTAIEAGFEYNTTQAHQEYVEAQSLYIMINEERTPALKELGTNEISYLLGLLDAVGELKREAFDALRKGKPKKTEAYYQLMLEIYDSTVPMRFANAIVPEFRKKQDVARMQIERTGTELLFFSDKKHKVFDA